MSNVWKNFTKEINSNSATCDICSKTYVLKDGSTSSLRRHLMKDHNISLDTVSNSSCKRKSADQPTLVEFISKKHKLDASNITEHVAKLFIKDLQPLSIVEDEGFRSLMNLLAPDYDLPSRVTFRQRVIPSLYEKCAQDVKAVIAAAPNYCITTDAWSSRTCHSYVTYTMHTIDDDFSMRSFVVGTYRLDERHSACNLGKHLMSTLTRWGIVSQANSLAIADHSVLNDAECTHQLFDVEDDAPFIVDYEKECGTSIVELGEEHISDNIPADLLQKIYITTDNASNISKAVKESGLCHVRCFAHTVNLAVQKAVGELDVQLCLVRDIINYFHRSNIGTSSLEVRE